MAFGDDVLGVTLNKEWYNKFKDGCTSVDSKPCSGRSSASQNYQVIAKVNAAVIQNHRGCLPLPTWCCAAQENEVVVNRQLANVSITTMLQHIPCTWFKIFGQKTRLLWFTMLFTLLIEIPASSACSPNSRGHWKENNFRQERTLWLKWLPT